MSSNVDSGNWIRLELRIATLLALLVLAFQPDRAAATAIQATASGVDGEDSFTALLTIDDAITPGSLVLTLAVQGDDSRIRIKGLASGLANDTLLSGLSVVGDDVKRQFFNLGQVVEGRPPIDPACTTCDMVVGFRKPGRYAPDRAVSFTISHETQPLDLGLFSNQDFAVLLQVKGAFNSRGAEHGFFFHDKKFMILEGEIGSTVIPEPSTAVLMLLGLTGLSIRERRRARAHQD